MRATNRLHPHLLDMRISFVIILMCLACKSRPSTETSSAKPVVAPPAKVQANTPPPVATATAPTTPTGNGSAGMCCCVGPDSKDGDVFVESCTKPSKCVTPWTQQCTDDFDQQQVADQRNEANAACPSND